MDQEGSVKDAGACEQAAARRMLAPVDADELRSEPEELYQRRSTIAGPEAPARAPEPIAALTQLASSVGNRGFGRAVARMRDGDGILPGGLVHPDIESAIAAASGRGRPLDSGVARQVGSTLGDPLSDVRVHHDDHAAALSRAVSARAFTVGRDVFFGAGEYTPGTQSGRELLTHELAHVVQQRGAADTGPLRVSQPGEPLELEAEAAARGLE
jgi:hypothetical protein